MNPAHHARETRARDSKANRNGARAINRRTVLVLLAVILLTLVSATVVAGKAVETWPSWRGPLGTGEAPSAAPPVRWSETENVRFKLPLPGEGHGTPAVWGDRLYLTAAVPEDASIEPRYSGVSGAHDNRPVDRRFAFTVLAVDRLEGIVLWRKTVHRALPHEGAHRSATLASASPVTDGERVYAFFGSYGLYALDPQGEVVWQRRFGAMRTKHAHGEGASPVLSGDTLVINWDHEGQSFLVALDARDGTERWKVPRDEVTSWSTPIVVEVGDRRQVIVNGTERVRGYDLATGKVVWSCGGLSANVVASPVAANGMVFVASSYDTRALFAIRLEGAKGDVTGTEHVVWSRDQRTPYVPSPLLVDGALYFLRHYQPILSRVDAATGAEPTGPFRLTGLRNIYASPIAANGHIYVTDREGTTLVLRQGPELGVASINRLDDRFSASPVAVGGDLYLRGERFLFALSANDSAPPGEERLDSR